MVSSGVIKFAICNEIFQNWNLEEAMRFAARAGYQGLEIAPFTLANDVTRISCADRKRIRDLADRTGISICGIHWVLVKTEGMHLTGQDEATQRRTSQYFVDLVDFCADLGGTYIVVGSPKQRNLGPNVTCEQGRATAARIFNSSTKRAAERNVTICFEPLAPSETNFINTAAEAISFMHEVNSPHFKIILDAKAMCSDPDPIPQIIRASAPHFAHFHANDRNLKGPGFGDVDFRPIASALKEVSYDGYVSVEVFNFEDGAETIATQSIDYLKKCFTS